MAAPAPRYAYAILSLSQTIPTLPTLGDLDVNRSVMADTPIDQENLTNAIVVVEKMKAILGKSRTKATSSDMLMDIVQTPQ